MVIVDTSVLIDYLNNTINRHTIWMDQQLGQETMGLTDLILCEVLQGLQADRAVPLVFEELSTFEIFNTGGEELAIASAMNYRVLRTRGHTVRKTIDCLIATFCIENRHSLLHRDRDFDPFERYLGLKVIHPSVH